MMRIKTLYISIILALLSAVAVKGQGILGIDGEESTSVGIYVKELATGKVLVDHNSQRALTPASVMKAVTSASALSVLGADGCFATDVYLRGAKGAGAVWNGDIFIAASGDPTLESENFKSKLGFCDSIAVALKRKGISRVSGAIVVSQTMKDAGPNIKWEVEDIAWPYGTGLWGFNWRDNCARLYPVTGRTVPEVPGLKVDLRKVTGGNDIVRGIFSDRLIAYTRDTKNAKWSLGVSVPDPTAVFVAELRKRLSAAGITVGQKATAPAGTQTRLYTHRSVPYSDILRSLMVRSDNLFAEGMLRAIAPDASRDGAIKREREIWATRGVNPRYTIIHDGSGLTRANRLSPRFLGDMLEWMARSPMAKTYAGFFPRAGKDGTLRGFLAKTPLVGEIALKTGSVSSVQCYAGYKLDADANPTHVIVIMVNGFFCPRRQVREGAEDLLLDLFDNK